MTGDGVGPEFWQAPRIQYFGGNLAPYRMALTLPMLPVYAADIEAQRARDRHRARLGVHGELYPTPLLWLEGPGCPWSRRSSEPTEELTR